MNLPDELPTEKDESVELGDTKNKEGDPFGCYYCNDFLPTEYKNDYERHIVLNHPGKPAYPSVVDMKKTNLHLKEKVGKHDIRKRLWNKSSRIINKTESIKAPRNSGANLLICKHNHLISKAKI